MGNLTKQDISSIEDLFIHTKKFDQWASHDNLYSLFGITQKKGPFSKEEIEKNNAKINSFFNSIRSGGKFKEFSKVARKYPNLCKRALSTGKNEYDNYLQQGKIKKVKDFFIFQTEDDHILDSSERINLIKKGVKEGLTETEIDNYIHEWLKIYNVKEEEISTSSTPSAPPPPSSENFSNFFHKTYYQVLGVPEDADVKLIEQAYKREQQKYINIKGKNKLAASARFDLVQEAYKCLKDNVSRREYDQKLKEPKGPVPTGTPKLSVERPNKLDYPCQDIARGQVLSEQITIKNTQGGLLQGTIKTDSPWLEVDKDKLLEIHEQKLTVRILTSKIPRNTSQVEGKVTIETNGEGSNRGREEIKYKIILEDFKHECIRFHVIYLPLIAAVGGFFTSFTDNANELADLAFWVTLIIPPLIIIQDKTIQAKEKIGAILTVAAVALVGGGIFFLIIILLGFFFPHFFSFLMGGYVVGLITYYITPYVVKATSEVGLELFKPPKELLHGLTVGVVILTLFFMGR